MLNAIKFFAVMCVVIALHGVSHVLMLMGWSVTSGLADTVTIITTMAVTPMVWRLLND